MQLKELKYYPIGTIRTTKDQLNLTDEEKIVFDDTIRGRTITQIAMKIGCCERTIGNMKRDINRKLENIN